VVKQRWPDLFSDGKMRIPKKIVDGLNLILASDLSSRRRHDEQGGRVAGRSPFTVSFVAKIGAVDQYLSKTGG